MKRQFFFYAKLNFCFYDKALNYNNFKLENDLFIIKNITVFNIECKNPIIINK